MQLKFKKICFLTTIFVYCFSFLLQSNFAFFQAWAKEDKTSRVNIVAVLVDKNIYDGISGGLKWYASEYIQQQLSDTKALVIPLDLKNIHAYDIYRMMENIYFDGLKDENSSLIGLIMVGDVPMPVVNQNGYIFPTVYPYVDFEEQKYVWDPDLEYFVPNNNPMGQAEIWHGLINYGNDIQAYADFFEKIKKYVKNPEGFVGDSMWYDDFIAQKKGFLNENFPYYRNRIMFAEDLGYQRYSPLMKKMFRGEQTENALDIVSELEDATDLSFSGKDVVLEMADQGMSDMHSTQMIQQEVQTSFISDYGDLFSKINMSTMRENIFAGGRWIKEYEDENGEKSMVVDSDSTASKLQLKDDILLGNDNLQGLIENLNDLMEEMIDKKIENEKYGMDIVVPVSYKKVTKKTVWFKRYYFVDRYDNYYFGNNARLIDNAENLSIYRGTYRNLSDLSGVSYNSLTLGENSITGKYEKTDLKLKSIGGSYDIFSNQVEGNRGYAMLNVENDLNIYDENKTQKDSKKEKSGFLGRVRKRVRPEACESDNDKQCELLYDFAQRWWGGASPINLDMNSISRGRYALSGYLATDSWRPIFDVGGFQSLLSGSDEGMNGTGWIDGYGTGPQWAANSFKAYIKYASPTQREGWTKRKWGKYEYYENHTPDVHKSFSDMDYFRLDRSIISGWTASIDTLSDKIFNIFKKKSGRVMEQYSYKVISSVVKHKSTTDDQINGLDRNRYGEDGILSMYYNDVKSAYEDLQASMSDILVTLSGLMVDINSGNVYIADKFEALSDGISELNLNGNVSGVNAILDDIDRFVEVEHSNLSGFYNLLHGLYVENIISVMDYIIYMEGGSRTGNFVDLEKKIGFLPIWLSDINDFERSITGSIAGIISNYSHVWSGINVQKGNWSNLYEELNNKNGLNTGKIEEISEKFDNIFWIKNEDDESNDEDDDHFVDDESDGEEDDSTEVLTGIMLTGGTARALLDIFKEDLNNVDVIFSNLFELDTVGPQIEIAAKNDNDFRDRLRKNQINFSSYTQSDWINQYVQWVKGPGYDSEGAKKNHDLLQGISEHITGMNILTPDRPIDSPRYVSMQSVAGNEIKFIYPDLFKVEVYKVKAKNKSGYDIHELLMPEKIKKNLEKYLSGKVYEYNKILQDECKKAKQMDLYYNKLKVLGYAGATPITGEHGCNSGFTYDEFVEALGGEKMLDVISETLYYQSLTNKKKLSTGNISDDIDLIKKSFGLNDKRGQILKDYLTEGNERIKNPVFEIPTYELSGYEVAFINSDGKDYIFSDEVLNDNSVSLGNNIGDSFDGSNRRITQQEKDIEDDCDIPSNGKLPLFKLDGTKVSSPWYLGFKCWLKKVREEPFKLRLTFDNSLGDIISDGFGDYIGNSLKKTWDEYVDSWDSMLNPSNSYDSDNVITQMQVDAEKHNKDVTSGEDGLSKALYNLSKNLRISNENVLLSDSNPTSELRIESMVDLGNVTIEFIGTGDGCLKIGSESLCNGQTLKKVFNPKTYPYVGIVSSLDHVAGKVGLIMNIGIGGGYINNIIKYTVSPSVLDYVDINVGDGRSVGGMLTPIEVVGYDTYGNKVSWGLEKYYFTVSQGRFLRDGAYQSGFSTNDFRDLRFYYQAPSDASDGSISIFQIKAKNGKVLKTRNLHVVQANPVVSVNGNVVLEGSKNLIDIISYKLKDDENIYSGGKLNISKLQKLDIDIRNSKGNMVDVDTQVVVRSMNGLFVVGSVNKQENGEYIFSETSKGYIESGHLSLYYYPTTVAGDDIMSIDIPGLDTSTIKFSVLPSDSKSIKLNIENEYVELGDTTYLEMFVSDTWGNPTNMEFKVQYDPEYVELPGLSEIYSDQDKVVSTVNIKDGYLKTLIRGVGAGYTSIDVGIGDAENLKLLSDIEFSVNDDLLPETGLNVMYLNYFGNDRGNQRGYLSKNNKHVESLMKKSNKIITTTTLLASEDKIKKVVWEIKPGFKITNFDGLDTKFSMKSGKLNMSVGGLSEMQVTLPSFNWVTATITSVESLLKSNKNDDYIFFIPSESSYNIKKGILYNFDEAVTNIMDGDLNLQLSDQVLNNCDNVWNVIYKGVNYGKFIVHLPSLSLKVADFNNLGNRYLVGNLFTNGSTDTMSSIGLFDMFSEFELDSSYKSIQNSDEIAERVGFLGDFKNITLFAEGEIVGEATKKYGSELLINLGDPVLSRKDVNEKVYGTDYDGGIGKEIYSDPEKDIFGTYQIDFNNDGLKDWLVVYLDGGFKLAKNYGGKPDLRDMQELMRVAVRVKDVFVGDADGNKYEDIFVLTDNNQLRVYLNDGGKFDVDGTVACLNQNVFEGQVSSTPSDLKGLNQFFVEDMDLDNVSDIITYDEKGYIKVFYGGSTKKEPNYLSKEKYACDSGWYDREINNTTVVTALGLQIYSGDIYDNSMMHRVGLSKPEMEITEDNLSEFGVNFDPDNLEGLISIKDRDSAGSIERVAKEVMDKDKFDVSTASSKFVNDESKYVDVTLNENTLVGGGESRNYVFVPISFLDPNNRDDKCVVRKNYRVKSGNKILTNGDVVSVRVTVKASDFSSCIGSYGDVIQGPWNVYYDTNNIIKGIRFLQNKKDSIVKSKDGNFSYIIDNIKLSPGEKMIFEYDLQYHALPLKKVSISYDSFWSNDKLPDIKLQSVDGCVKDFDGFLNMGRRIFQKQPPIYLQKYIDKEYEEEDNMTKDYGEDIINNGSNVNQLPGMVKDKIDRIKLLKSSNVEISDDEEGRQNLKSELLRRIQEGGLEALNISLNINLSIFEEQLDAIEDVVDDLMKGMCNGFSFGGSNNCKGLPVPFNQAFLAPGKYHLFGCWELPMGPLEGGIPVFHYPGTIRLPTPAGTIPIPFPWGEKSSADDFLWMGGGVYPSFIRIYAAPTLTAQLGIAICMSPSAIWSKIPSPISDIAGNCVVFAVKPQCKGGDTTKKKDENNPNEIYDNFIEDVRDSGVCLQSQKGLQVTKKGHRSSPFDLCSYSTKTNQYLRGGLGVDVNGGSNNDLEFDASVLGIINLETLAYIGGDTDTPNENNSFFVGDVDILGGDFTVNKIRGGIQQGVRKLLIDKWLDPQIRYIVNQLTKMHVNIKLPDVSNLITNDVQLIKDSADKFKNQFTGTKNMMPAITGWSSINSENLEKFNKAISNPFEALAGLLNESNIINISVEPLTVKVPMIYSEDINEYSIYLQQWLDVNGKILSGWASVLDESQFELAIKGWERLQNQVYVNLMTLQKYRNFPFEIYEWIHVIDRYMSEIASLINNTIGYLAYWTSTNSQRFVGYVDAIVLILNIIKTYQLLINFSVEWGQSCGNCTKDTYDQYSCKLSLLCDMIQLPIIQIPNFKLPNITIDLSDIDLSLDIILPDFNFQPVKVSLPELSNLPEAPSLGFGIELNLPNIPMLPEPPELPELPSFIPQVDLELPVLPPAPELPKLPNEIESIIKVAKIIGKIYCIVKGKFGLVGESSVKAKIEQLTQRTYEVKWIDTIMDFTNRSVAPVHNYGLDYEISSQVDLHFDFSVFYNYLDTLTKSINNLSTSTTNWVNSKVDTIVNDNPVVGVLENIDSLNANLNLELGMSDVTNMNGSIDGLLSDEIEYVDYDSAKSRLEDVLVYFNNETKNTTMGETIQSSINNIRKQINKSNTVVSNVEGIEKLQNDVMKYLDNQKSGYDTLANLINTDYEGFLAMVDSQSVDEKSKSSSNSGGLLTFNVKLFNVDSSTKDVIENITKTNPYESILSNKKSVIDGYWNAINSNTANDLGLTESQYLVLRNNISSVKNQITTIYSITKPISSTELIAKNSTVSTNKTLLSSSESSRLGSNMEVADVIDPSVLSEGIYAKINKGADSGKLTKVVYSDSFASDVGQRYYHTDRFRGGDIVLYNDGGVYLKCTGGECTRGGGEEKGKYYVSATVSEIPYKETWLKFGGNLKLKIADGNIEVKNRKVSGQTYDSLQFSRSKNDGVDGYLIKLVERIDNSYEKKDYTSVATPVKYVLAVPEGTNVEELYSNNVKLELLRKTDKMKDLFGKDLVEIVYYDDNKNALDVLLTLQNLKRLWYYGRISTLKFEDNTYKISSPWSNQIVAGKQIVGDDLPPEGNPLLYRPSTKNSENRGIVSQGTNLEGYVGTKYNLIVNWKDNVSLSYINLSKGGKILDEKYTTNISDIVSTSIDIHTQEGYETYSTVGIDQFGNKTEKQIIVNYSVPDISITDISKNSDGKTVSIKAKLSQDIDQGNVSFQRNRGSSWKTMKTNSSESSDFSLKPLQDIIVGGSYSIGNGVAMYDKNGEVIALLDPNTAEIKMQSGFENKYDIGVIVQNGLVLQLRDKKSKDSVFSISIPTESCSIIEASNYNIVDLPEAGKMGMFNGGKAVYKDGNNVLFMSPTYHLYSEIGLEGTYLYDRGQGLLQLTMYQPSDLLMKANPIKLLVKVKPYFD